MGSSAGAEMGEAGGWLAVLFHSVLKLDDSTLRYATSPQAMNSVLNSMPPRGVWLGRKGKGGREPCAFFLQSQTGVFMPMATRQRCYLSLQAQAAAGGAGDVCGRRDVGRRADRRADDGTECACQIRVGGGSRRGKE